MNVEEYATLIATTPVDPTIKVADLTGGDRTLLYGYDIDRDTWHIYLKDGMIHRHIYSLRSYSEVYGHPVIRTIMHDMQESWTVVDLIPNKRAFPERTDYEFARIVKERGGDISFTTYDDDIEPEQFYGSVL